MQYTYKCLINKNLFQTYLQMEASEPKLVNPVLNIIGVSSLRLGSLYIWRAARQIGSLRGSVG